MDTQALSFLKNSLAGTKYSLDKYILQANTDFTVEGKHITGHVHYFPIDENTGKPDTANFAQYIMGKLIAFCVPPAQQQLIKEAAESENDASMELVQAASETLKAISERKDGKKSSSGEIGELILFVLLEGVLGAPAVASKPYLKMNGQDQVKGCDGVHILYDGNDVVIYYGESKLSPDADYCVSDSAKSIKAYHANGGKKKGRDLSVIAQNVDLNISGDHKEAIENELLYYLNPVKRKKKERTYKEINACFLGFDHDSYKKLEAVDKAERNQLLLEEITKGFPAILNKIDKSIDSDISDYNFHYFIMPFDSVSDLQKLCEEYLKPFSFHKGGNK